MSEPAFQLAQVNIGRARGGCRPATGPRSRRLTFAEPFEAGGRPVPRKDVPRGDACPAG